MKARTLLALAATLAAIGGSAWAQVQISQDGRPERMFKPVSGLDKEDIKFLKQAALIDSVERQMAEIGLKKASTDFVREYAKEMLTDHDLFQNEVIDTAHAKGITVMRELPDEMQHMLNELNSTSSGDFDRAYGDAQKRGHEAAIHLFQWEIENGRDQDVKALAVKELPTIELHYKMALAKKTMMGPEKMAHGM